MIETATLSSTFQITIPESLCVTRHWKVGLTLAFIPKGAGVMLVPVPKREHLEGLARGETATNYRDRAHRF